ncbi:hypothetical protein N0V90_002655 [Kalmusia sp. IMI 367209]|nr:hypothetical protein N0V90_002655 [Kalmusia sp. IMI 367209]
MSSGPLAVIKRMLLPGVILLPTVAPHAVQDLADLKTIIDSTAATINAAPNNSSWGFFSPASPAGALGTADLIANISTTILRAKYLLDVDKIAWITVPDNTTAVDPTTTETSPRPPTLTPTPPSEITLDTPYTTYVSSIPTLANALVALGRAWHKELNTPVSEAIAALQQTVTTFSTSMLEANLLNSSSILRTIRASSTLESAQVAWSRALNLPGNAGARKREVETLRKPLDEGQFYTHKDLWGRNVEGGLWRKGEQGRRSSEEAEKVARRFAA